MAPDWAFITKERLPGPLPRGFVPLVPDIVLETRSPGETQPEVEQKIRDWLTAGGRAALDLDPVRRTLTVYLPGEAPRVFEPEDEFTLEDALPGFAVPMRRFFPGSHV
jgi:Uma2 family endonuclease